LREKDVGYVVLNGPFFRMLGIEGKNRFNELKFHLDNLAIKVNKAIPSEIMIYKIPSY
jgi:hypothetical protein